MSGPRVGSGFGGSGARNNEDIEPLNNIAAGAEEDGHQPHHPAATNLSRPEEPTLMQQAQDKFRQVEQFADEMVLSEIEKHTVMGRPITRRMSLAMVAGCLAATILIIVVIVKSISGGNRDPSVRISSAEGKERYQLFIAALEPLTGRTLTTAGSPEEQALYWLSYKDPKAIDPRTNIDKITQRFVLATLYFATNGDGWAKSCSFLSYMDECDWNDKDGGELGVKCNSEGFVEDIALSNHNLGGTLPRDFGLLTHLSHVDLSNNKMHSELPSTFGILGKLKHLDLSHNLFTGFAPNNGKKWTNLNTLKLGKHTAGE